MLAFAALQADLTSFRQRITAIIVGTLTAITIAFALNLLVRLPSYGREALARSTPTLLNLGIAVVAGEISGYAKIEPKIFGTVTGTAIAEHLL